MKSIHYVANVVIKRVEVEDGRVDQKNYHQTSIPPARRKVGDVISLTVRGGELEDLKQQLKDHLLVVKDDIDVPLDEKEA